MTSLSDPTPAELAVGAIVIVDGHLLVVQRGRPPGAGLWTVPGGRVEPGERVEAAVEREILEETGLSVTCGALVGWVQRMSDGYNYVILDFLATPTSLEPTGSMDDFTVDRLKLQPGDDAAAAQWASDKRLSELPLVPGLMEFLKQHKIVPLVYSSSSPVELSDD